MVVVLDDEEALDEGAALAELEVAVVGVEPELDAVVVDLRAASAGSCPDTSTTAISSHAARNSATAPATTRRRIACARRARDALMACGF